MKQPHALIMNLLDGPQVPNEFLDNGCSNIPNLFMRWACRIHDYEYYQLRRIWRLIERREELGSWSLMTSNSLTQKEMGALTVLKIYKQPWNRNSLIKAWNKRRKLSDKHLRHNVKMLTFYKIVMKDGMPKRVLRPIRGSLGWSLYWIIYIGVRIGGKRSAKIAEKQDERNE